MLLDTGVNGISMKEEHTPKKDINNIKSMLRKVALLLPGQLKVVY